MDRITSVDNKLIKELIKIRDDSKYRKETKLCFLEGERLIYDTDNKYLDKIFISEDYNNDLSPFDDKKIYELEDKVYKKVKNTTNSQGIIATAILNNEYRLDDLYNDNFILILDDIRDPGNLGTIFRTAEASGVDAIILSKNSCDVYSDKVLRSSMSSVFRVKHYVSENIVTDIKELKNNGFKIIGTSLDSNINYYDFDRNDIKKFALIIGNEANGISNEVFDTTDMNVKIDMSGKIESLNAAIATAIICFELRKKIKNEKT